MGADASGRGGRRRRARVGPRADPPQARPVERALPVDPERRGRAGGGVRLRGTRPGRGQGRGRRRRGVAGLRVRPRVGAARPRARVPGPHAVAPLRLRPRGLPGGADGGLHAGAAGRGQPFSGRRGCPRCTPGTRASRRRRSRCCTSRPASSPGPRSCSTPPPRTRPGCSPTARPPGWRGAGSVCSAACRRPPRSPRPSSACEWRSASSCRSPTGTPRRTSRVRTPAPASCGTGTRRSARRSRSFGGCGSSTRSAPTSCGRTRWPANCSRWPRRRATRRSCSRRDRRARSWRCAPATRRPRGGTPTPERSCTTPTATAPSPSGSGRIPASRASRSARWCSGN